MRLGDFEVYRELLVQETGVDIDPNKTYLVQEATTGQTILRATGKQLAEVGFGVKIKATYGGQLFGISAQ